MLTQSETVPLSTALPVMLLGLPMIDTLMVMSQRWRAGQPLFQADKRHIHHKLLDLGFDHYESVLLIYLLHAVFFLFAWLMRYEPDPYILLAFFTLAGLVVVTLITAGRLEWHWRRPALRATGRSAMGRAALWLGRTALLPRWALGATVACILVYLAAVLVPVNPSRDVGLLALFVAVPTAICLWVPALRDREAWVIRAVLCTTVAMAVYLDHQTPDTAGILHSLKITALPLLGLCVLLRMRFSERRFEITTLDVLLIFIAIVIPSLPGLGDAPGNLALSIVKLVVLLYAVELCIDQGPWSRRAVSLIALTFCLGVLARAFL
jgi:UDP-GlcNAc:undecaprenyl-phosphate GlcNAc-1-phosphate transferase